MKFKEHFSEIFTILAWITLLGFVLYCTVTENTSDSIRDAWNILILIAGFVWGSSQKARTADKTTTEVNKEETIITQENKTV